MGFALFHYTIMLLLVIVLASAVCLSSFLVSRRKMVGYACLAFLFYFFDVALTFQRDFFAPEGASNIVTHLFMVVAGCGFLTAFWLMTCEYVNERRMALRVAPACVFVVASCAALVFVPEGGLRSFLFYLPREAYLFWILLFVMFRYLAAKEEAERARMRRRAIAYAVVWVMGICVVVEDALVFLPPEPLLLGLRAFAPERNISENVLLLLCAMYVCRHEVSMLMLRYERPPSNGDERQEARIDDNLLLYARRHALSAREGEVLRLVLMGYDNQNIASEMQLALSTVKVHVHNILKKTGMQNRQALIRDFWEMS